MIYNHKIEATEIKTTVKVSQDAKAGLQVVVGTAPVNMAAPGSKTANTPIVCMNFEEAKRKLGYSDDFAQYTLCEAMDVSFRKFGISPIVFINVLDPKKHKKAIESLQGVVNGGRAVFDKAGILVDTLTVTSDSKTLERDKDFVAEFDDSGKLVLSFVNLENGKTVTLGGFALDPSMVSADDIIGGVNSDSGEETGLEVVRQVYPKTGYVAGQLVVPKWSMDEKVAAVMASKVEKVDGIFDMTAVIDIDTGKYKKYTDLANAKKAMGIFDCNCVLCWPQVMIGDQVYHYSTVWAAMAACTDAQNGDVPYKSPSNKEIMASATVLSDGTEIYLDNTQAALVNSYGIVTAINDQGWKAWGNETAAYPDDRDVKNRYISCRRMMNWYRNRFITTYKEKVDDPMNRRLIESFIDSENQYLNGLAASGFIPSGCSVSYHEDKNPIERILDGKIVFETQIAFFPPAKHIVAEITFNPQLIKDALTEG